MKQTCNSSVQNKSNDDDDHNNCNNNKNNRKTNTGLKQILWPMPVFPLFLSDIKNITVHFWQNTFCDNNAEEVLTNRRSALKRFRWTRTPSSTSAENTSRGRLKFLAMQDNSLLCITVICVANFWKQRQTLTGISEFACFTNISNFRNWLTSNRVQCQY